ncbi:hypothetical protein [Novipirellula maiorica]|uniref:hypothetical protein n=1 Tax=Novipirellula maiorica TaxID=1265734 RepID=UPI001F439CC4|nr:hypothetical protein [Rhodopirellula maiorica]
MSNPFEPPIELQSEKGVFGDHAIRATGRFLYRVIQFQRPFTGTLVYSGWWFRQKIEINGVVVWWKVSWLNISPDVLFTIPPEVYANQASPNQAGGDDVPHGTDLVPSQPIQGRIEIQFTRGLRIRRFRVWFDQQIAYDEIA